MTRYTPLWLQAGNYAAAVDRYIVGQVWPAGMVTGCAVTAGTGMQLNVARGAAAVPITYTLPVNGVLCAFDATEPVTLAASPQSGTNRIDLVIIQARGADIDGGANNDFIVTSVTGAAASSPAVPAVPVNAIALAQVYVTGGAASIVQGNITDLRVVPPPPMQPRGVVGYGPQVSAPGSNAILTVNGVLHGAPSWLAANTVTIPAGAGGLYLIQLAVNFVSSTTAAVGFSVRNAAGADFAPIMRTYGMVAAGNPDNNAHGTWLRQCPDGDTLRVYNSGNPIASGTARVDRFSVVRLGDALATI